MWISGITQGMMWRDFDQWGNLTHPFIDTVRVLFPYYLIRAIGGTLYLIGFIMFIYNVVMTITASKQLESEPKSASPMAA